MKTSKQPIPSMQQFSDFREAKAKQEELYKKYQSNRTRLDEIAKIKYDTQIQKQNTLKRAEALLSGTDENNSAIIDDLTIEEKRLIDEQEVLRAALRIQGERLDVIRRDRSHEINAIVLPEYEKLLREYVAHSIAANDKLWAIAALRESLTQAGALDCLPTLTLPGDRPDRFEGRLDYLRHAAKMQKIEL